MKTRKLLLLTLLLSAAVPAATFAQVRPTDEAIRTANLHGTVIIGMTMEEVQKSFGYPDRINSYENPSGITEQWVYANRGNFRIYCYFKKGILTSWQRMAVR